MQKTRSGTRRAHELVKQSCAMHINSNENKYCAESVWDTILKNNKLAQKVDYSDIKRSLKWRSDTSRYEVALASLSNRKEKGVYLFISDVYGAYILEPQLVYVFIFWRYRLTYQLSLSDV